VRILSIVHHDNAAAGVFREPAAAARHELIEWLPHDGPPPRLDGIEAALALGGEAHADQDELHPWLAPEKALLRELLERDVPTLGICLGSQLLAQAAGGEIRPAAVSEVGWYEIELTDDGAADPLLGFLPRSFEGFEWHHYEWLLPPGAKVLARSDACLQAFRLGDRPFWGIQSHPEVTLPDLESWLDEFYDDPAAVTTGQDPEALRADSRARIAGWNAVGRGIAARFYEVAATRALRRRPTGRHPRGTPAR